MTPPGTSDEREVLAEARASLAGPGGVQAVVDLLAALDDYSWVGVYVVVGDVLVLGPWRGPAATEHVRIPVGEGICGAAAASGRTEIVADVAEDDRYLACFASTRSEIVVPIVRDGAVVGEIDVDSDRPGAFGESDRRLLEEVATLLAGAVEPALVAQ